MVTRSTLARENAVACCSPVAAGTAGREETAGREDAAGQDDAERIARTFKALGDPTRVRLLSLIAASDGGEACICDLIDPVGLSQPTVSHHMKTLVDAGLVTRDQRGKWAYFAVVQQALNNAADVLRSPEELASLRPGSEAGRAPSRQTAS